MDASNFRSDQQPDIVEPTSENTGIALAFVAGVPRGYPITLTMPETTSREGRKVLAAFNA